jgi:addiction module RelE/StbE family toxin
MWTVILNKSAQKEFNKAPIKVQEEFVAWMNLVSASGPQVLLSINGYWDHSLKGDWSGARSSSLNKKWRVIYYAEQKAIKVMVLQISAHKY